MTTPTRIQLRRTKGWRLPADAVHVARPGRWGNPFTGADPAGEFERYIAARRAARPGWTDLVRYPSDAEIAEHLRGRSLACWCPPSRRCHADTLLAVANGSE